MPLLSNVIFGRNDDYNPYFINRVNYVIEYTSWLLSEYKIDNNSIETIIVDWGSDTSLKDSIKLSRNSLRMVKFVQVDKNIALNESLEEKGNIHVAKAYNTAIRLSESEFINFTSHDLLFDRISLINLINYLNIIKKESKDVLINVQRKFLPINLFFNTPSFMYLNRWLETSGRLKGDYGVMHGGGQAGYITSKKIWQKLTGIYEKFDGYGFLEYDFFARATNICNWVDSNNIGVSMFKIHRGDADKRDYAKKNYLNKQWTAFSLNPNKIWGLSNYNLKLDNKHNFQDFDFKKLNLIKYKDNFYKNTLSYLNKVIYNSYNAPVSIRLNQIKFNDVKLILNLNYLFNLNRSVRSIISIGYRKEFIPLISSEINSSLELFILDDIYFISNKERIKRQANNQEYQNLGLLDRRVVRLAQILMDKINPHNGYLRSFTGDIKISIQSLNKAIPKEDLCNIIIVNSEMIDSKNYNDVEKFILNNSQNIYCFFAENRFVFSNLISKDYMKISIRSNYYLYLNKKYKFYDLN